jgi:hypothetical protein
MVLRNAYFPPWPQRDWACRWVWQDASCGAPPEVAGCLRACRFKVRNYGPICNPLRAEYLERCKKLLGVVETEADPDPPDEGQGTAPVPNVAGR